MVEVARIELASKEETYFRLRDLVHLDTIPLENEQKTEKSGLNVPSHRPVEKVRFKLETASRIINTASLTSVKLK